ncbi:DNA helicase II [Halorhodospira abdelmalekii]|uniref:UvrD-helicase domain-containing protein n=1 Tax=Halorhodospira abdelmalekii TaxID=421629 RepID=UPI001906B6D4|nr:UvrD-helicase domain-containing protein [Halorhodospira abdelmalekii]MBK1734220.1 DNA helicase II [Halorhodospira abdelmalekii]
MDLDTLLSDLNDAQRRAVCLEGGRALVLAGAGSGKTRVLTRRAAYLIRFTGLSPFALLAVTFTNKAAGEMRGRISELLGIATSGMWVGTFHGIAHRLLRQHAEQAGLPEGFQILDADDQLRLVKRVLRARGTDENRLPPRQVRGFIAARKEEGVRPEAVVTEGHRYQQELLEIYRDYEESCRRGGLVDFAELLLRADELLAGDEGLLAHYRRRFQHILVDELQDTNAMQYRWLTRLIGEGTGLFAVGDDDQSIYGWRGARVENMDRLCRELAPVEIVRLEQNYRSTATILQAANHLIAHNDKRLGKNLWTSGDQGEPITLYRAFNEVDEARWVIDRINDWIEEEGYQAGDFAILYRSNAQSRAFEEALIAHRLPYRVYGGVRFFERAEVKDALAYLRLVMTRHDDASFERAVVTPPRGVGAKTLDAIRTAARAQNTSLWSAAQQLVAHKQLAARARNAVHAFLELIDDLEQRVAGEPLQHQAEHAISSTGLRHHYERDESRLENLDELVSAARSFAHEGSRAGGAEAHETEPLLDFLTHAALEAGEGQAADWGASVQLMSLHAAKGLEFPVVFLTGLEEGLFPHYLSADDPVRLEEERRLCYVGMTRARTRLCLTCAEVRRIHGRDQEARPSRFLGELPLETLDEVRPSIRIRLR